MSRVIMILILLTLFTACATIPSATDTPPTPTLSGSVDILFPQDGTIIYSELIYLAGTAQQTPTEGFRLRLLDAEENIIAETTVQPQDGEWSVELAHNYTGDPTEVIISASPLDTALASDYDVASVVLSTLENRPEGVYASILAPLEGESVGGDFIEISGTASGVFENTIVVRLENASDTISQQIVTLTNPYFIDEVPWTASLPTQGASGPVTVRVLAQDANSGQDITLSEVNISIGGAAG